MKGFGRGPHFISSPSASLRVANSLRDNLRTGVANRLPTRAASSPSSYLKTVKQTVRLHRAAYVQTHTYARSLILFNGRALSEIDLAAFRRRIGIVFQDNPIVAGSIRDNITLRDPIFTDKDVAKASRLSGFDDVVRRLPAGLNTCIDNRSCKLSGGERQRLALARALIRDPMILILDEATNHLDAESRKSLVALVRQIRRGRLILIAGHDPDLTQLCDRHISLQRTGVLCS